MFWVGVLCGCSLAIVFGFLALVIAALSMKGGDE